MFDLTSSIVFNIIETRARKFGLAETSCCFGAFTIFLKYIFNFLMDIFVNKDADLNSAKLRLWQTLLDQLQAIYR